MIKSVEELKQLVIWAKEQKLKSLRLGDINIEFSELSLLPDQVAYSESAPDISVPPKTFEQSLRESEAALFG